MVAPSATAALTVLFDRHHAALCRLATVLLGDAGAAEEVVQDAFLRVHARWWRIRDHERAYAYLRTAVVNQCRSRLRRRVTERRAVHAQWVEDERRANTTVAEADLAGDVLVLTRALRALPDRQREAVVLYYYEDLAVAEVAAILGCAPGTVKSQLAKARATLERELGDQGWIGSSDGAPPDRRSSGTGPVGTGPVGAGSLGAGSSGTGPAGDGSPGGGSAGSGFSGGGSAGAGLPGGGSSGAESSGAGSAGAGSAGTGSGGGGSAGSGLAGSGSPGGRSTGAGRPAVAPDGPEERR